MRPVLVSKMRQVEREDCDHVAQRVLLGRLLSNCTQRHDFCLIDSSNKSNIDFLFVYCWWQTFNKLLVYSEDGYLFILSRFLCIFISIFIRIVTWSNCLNCCPPDGVDYQVVVMSAARCRWCSTCIVISRVKHMRPLLHSYEEVVRLSARIFVRFSLEM